LKPRDVEDIDMAIAIRADPEIQQDVLAELDWDPEVDATEVGVQVDDGIVTLTGWVDSYSKKVAAEWAALRVEGVRAVANDLSVKRNATRTDADVAKAVVAALEGNEVVPSERIRITVKNGKVTLEGEVEWDYQRQATVNTVRHVTGVRDVIDHVTVKQRTVSSGEIREAIERALVRSAELDAARINVRVEGGHVVLTGIVRSVAEKTAAEAAAWRGKGVTRVTNEIEVRPV
jgi:osmotically-inducible protein OsmY